MTSALTESEPDVPVEGPPSSGSLLEPHLILTKEELHEAVEHCLQYPYFIFDVETDDSVDTTINNVLWVGLSSFDRVFLVPMGHPLGRELVPQHKEKVLPPLEERKWLEKSQRYSNALVEVTIPAVYAEPPKQLEPYEAFEIMRPLFFSDLLKVNHNIKFDLESIAKYYGGVIIPGPYADTMLEAHVLDENRINFELKPNYMDWAQVPNNPVVRKKFYPSLARNPGILGSSLDQVARYLAMDVWRTRIWHRYQKRVLDRRYPSLNQVVEVEYALIAPLARIELAGVRIDTEELEDRGQSLYEDILDVTKEVWDLCGEEFELTKLAKLRHYMFAPEDQGGQGLRPLGYTAKTKDPKLDKAVLEEYAGDNELAALLLRHSDLQKMYSTYITGLLSRLVDGRLHTGFKQHGTVTSRLSSAQPNLQNIPRGDSIRKAFIADEGHKLVVADYSQIELRVAAYLSGDQELKRVFSDKEDIHRATAAAMLRKDIEDVTDYERQNFGKSQNFLTLYGGGAWKLSNTINASREREIREHGHSESIEVTEEMAEEFIEAFDAQFSSLAGWKRREVRKARKTAQAGVVPYCEIPPVGRRRRIHELLSGIPRERRRAERQVINSLVQGMSAYIMKFAIIDLDQLLQETRFPAQIVLTVHDELHVHVAEEHAEEASEMVVATMEAVQWNGLPIIGDVPLEADANIGDSWATAKG